MRQVWDKKNTLYKKTKSNKEYDKTREVLALVYWHIHFQTNDAEYFFIDKATERGDAVASSIEVNAVQWENRQVN